MERFLENKDFEHLEVVLADSCELVDEVITLIEELSYLSAELTLPPEPALFAN